MILNKQILILVGKRSRLMLLHLNRTLINVTVMGKKSTKQSLKRYWKKNPKESEIYHRGIFFHAASHLEILLLLEKILVYLFYFKINGQHLNKRSFVRSLYFFFFVLHFPLPYFSWLTSTRKREFLCQQYSEDQM